MSALNEYANDTNSVVSTLRPTPRAPDKCGQTPALSGKRPQTADSASGGFVRQFPRLPVTPAVGWLREKQVTLKVVIKCLHKKKRLRN